MAGAGVAPRDDPGAVSLRVFLERAIVPFVLGSLAIVLVAVPGIPPFCPLRRILHVPCPSCGLTRAARLALAGDFRGATRMHPLWSVVLAYVGVAFIVESAGYLRDGSWGRWTGRVAVKRVGLAIVAALLAVWVARELGAFGGPVAI